MYNQRLTTHARTWKYDPFVSNNDGYSNIIICIMFLVIFWMVNFEIAACDCDTMYPYDQSVHVHVHNVHVYVPVHVY